MKQFLLSLKDFSKSVGGLVVVLILALWQIDIFNIFNIGFSLFTVGIWLSVVAMAFTIFWAQYKGKPLISHFILFSLYMGALSTFVNSLFSNSPLNAFTPETLVNLLAMLYTLFVSIAFVLYEKPKPTKLSFMESLPLIAFIVVCYITFGPSTAIIYSLIVLLILFVGTKIIALLYALSNLIVPVFSLINNLVNNASGFTLNGWFHALLIICVAAYLTYELVLSFKKGQS